MCYRVMILHRLGRSGSGVRDDQFTTDDIHCCIYCMTYRGVSHRLDRLGYIVNLCLYAGLEYITANDLLLEDNTVK